jgi:hypothetical protein
MNENETPTKPTFQERDAMWKELDFPSHSGSYPRTADYVAALSERFANGDVLFRSFSVPTHPAFNWYLNRNRLHECNFFERFWRCPSPAAAFPHRLAAVNYEDMSLFEWLTPFHLGGDLSSLLFRGGAYSHSTGYGQEARRIGEAAAEELLARDYEDTTLFFRCHSAWSDFFMDVAWDYTAVIVSKPRRLIHAILATDTD